MNKGVYSELVDAKITQKLIEELYTYTYNHNTLFGIFRSFVCLFVRRNDTHTHTKAHRRTDGRMDRWIVFHIQMKCSGTAFVHVRQQIH